jgi:hypothetical protein
MSTEPGDGDSAEEAARRTLAATKLLQQRLAAAQQIRRTVSTREPAEQLEGARARVQVEREESDLGLSKIVGRGTMILMSFQVLVIDGGFMIYGAENGWHIPSDVMVSWLAAGTVQVVGSVALVVARHLFPGKKHGNGNS